METHTQSLTSAEILDNILNAKGQFVKAVYKSNPTPAAPHKKEGIILEKHTSSVCRAGVNFANLSSVQAGIESGERGEVQPLAWGEWYVDPEGKSYFPYIKVHTPKGADKKQFYVRLYPTENTKPNVTYFVNGETVDKDTFASYLTPSAAKKLYEKRTDSDCFEIKMENILATEEYGEQ